MPIVKVTAAPGRRVPQESHPQRFYPDAGSPPMDVERTAHVSRLIVNGDLVLVDDSPATAAADKKGGK